MSIREQIDPVIAQWYAVHCKFRCEKRLMQELLEQGIEAYVPIQSKLRQYVSRKKRSEVALIPSHVFVKIIQSDYIRVLQHIHVHRFLNFAGVLLPIPNAEMEMMRRVVGECHDVALDTGSYAIGDEIEIIAGELTGLRGTLVSASNHNFKIALESLGMGLVIYVDPKYLLKTGSRKQVA